MTYLSNVKRGSRFIDILSKQPYQRSAWECHFGDARPSAMVRTTLDKLAGETGGHVEYPLNRLYKDVSGYLSNPQDAGNFAYTVGTGAYAAEISRGIIEAVAGISGEVTTQYVLRYIPDVDPEAIAASRASLEG